MKSNPLFDVFAWVLFPNVFHNRVDGFQYAAQFALKSLFDASFNNLNAPPTYKRLLKLSNFMDQNVLLPPLNVFVPTGDHLSVAIFHEAMYFTDMPLLLKSLTVVNVPPAYNVWLLLSNAIEYITLFVPF